ncbi:hypothetical protein, partial [Pseudomonas syringae]|uniref:hypothetical protein n=1 Tax=Pseudomonas syringae TaxID=317 RepID=UPI001F3EE1EA
MKAGIRRGEGAETTAQILMGSLGHNRSKCDWISSALPRPIVISMHGESARAFFSSGNQCNSRLGFIGKIQLAGHSGLASSAYGLLLDFGQSGLKAACYHSIIEKDYAETGRAMHRLQEICGRVAGGGGAPIQISQPTRMGNQYLMSPFSLKKKKK